MSRDNQDRSRPRTDAPTLSTAGSPGGPEDAVSSNGSDEYAAGCLINERFRIVGRLGGGGMGEVYRADDLVLETSVALKFLPWSLASDPVRLERLRNEVRVARQVAHPNVCRVFDIGDADGRPFLSMEYIDGEDLASLLRRIGRLPRDKAVDLAREICAGVAAAHELGVIHRDLKPANVMIDGRGRARVADFGLAGGAMDLAGGRDAMAGTPVYMAPEQLTGAGASKQTDTYALGLVLYEVFTGKRAHDTGTVEAALRGDSSSHTPTNPSELVDGLDPQVERVIMSCLADDPEDRPPSALSVLAALPGGDPLAAVLKAGEIPSPELVAASGRSGTLPRRWAIRLAAFTLIGLAMTLWNFGRHSLGDAIGGILPPEVLAHRAESLLADLGHNLAIVDSAWGYDLDWQLSSRLNSAAPAERRELLRSDAEPPLRFWYRSSPRPMVPWNASLPGNYAGNIVTPVDPPLTVPGMAFVRLGPRGNLMELRVAPYPSWASGSTLALDDLFTTTTGAAELEPSEIEELTWTEPPIMPGSSTFAWRVTDRRKEISPKVIVATLATGRPSWVKVMPYPTQAMIDEPTRARDRMGAFFFAFFVGGALLAIRNLRLGQWDRRGSTRLAVAAFILCFAGDFIGSHHTLDPGGEVRGFFMSTAYGAIRGLMTWILYVAIEPFIRKLRPKSMVSWSRLLGGRVTDPAVGRDVLLGLSMWAVMNILAGAWFAARGLLGEILPYWAFISGNNPLDTAESFAVTLRMSVVSLGSALGLLVVYVVLRRISEPFIRLAPALLWVGSFFFSFSAYHTALETIDIAVYGVVAASGITYLAVRHGLLTLATALFISNTGMFVVLTLDPTDWYFAPTAIFVALVVGLTVFGVRVATDRGRVVGEQ
jgi:serine/threonine-protein kinase